ncbi:winged helix-turn-helix transcriptional regulator [Microbacterium sp. NPDC055910]|uniref:winged helix-turn-helix transcriptional regulator n=1 Tax=Microbacterium sp. NPDC055910 TaxID=3345659 RepID=UPI0035DE1688
MPKIARPTDDDTAVLPLSLLGNEAKVGIIRFLRANPNSTRQRIADGLGITVATVSSYLAEFESAGVLLANPSKGIRKRGDIPAYRVNSAIVTELYLQLGLALGEI